MTDAPRIARDHKIENARRPGRWRRLAALGGDRTRLLSALRARVRKTTRQSGHFVWLLPVGALLVALPLLSWTFEAIAGLMPAPPAIDQVMTRPIALPATPTSLPGVAEPPPSEAAALDEEHWQIEKVRKGDTLASVFKRLGLGPRDVHKVVSLNEDTGRLTRIFPGDLLKFRLAEDGSFKALQYQLDEVHKLLVQQTPDGLMSETVADEIFAQVETADGQIDGSFFMAGRDAGLSDKLIMELAGLFGWDIDFVLDIRQGDKFVVLYEQLYRNGEYLRPGQIIAATFINQGQKFQAVRFATENGIEYFSPDGRNMRKAFLRAPLNFSYISSNFNPRRFHPILRRVKAHKGTDYRAPTGTPVYAAGHGKVIASARSKYNGNYVFVQHGANIVTRYLHFSRRTVKKGQRVKQGQVIGYVGATGLAEAPHLHYEFLVNGVHRNPRTVDLPKADPLPAAQLALFQRAAGPLLRQLESLQETELLATSR